MSLEEFKKKVNFIWNRFPKILCKRIVNRFDSLVQEIYNNNGNKENRKNRKEKKPKRVFKFRIKEKTFNNKMFYEYQDTIVRIAYNDKTFLELKKQMHLFQNTEISFYKKILVAIGSFINKNKSTKKGVSSNAKVFDLGDTYRKRIEAIIADRNKFLEGINEISEEAFWGLINIKLKENLICNHTLTNRKLKIENIMNVQTDEQNNVIYLILKYVKNDMDFSNNEKDLKEFCSQFFEIMKTKEQSKFTNQTISTEGKTYLDDDLEDMVNKFKLKECGEEEIVEIIDEEEYDDELADFD